MQNKTRTKMGENIHHQEVQMLLVSERMGHTSLTLLLELRRMKSLRACVRLTNFFFHLFLSSRVLAQSTAMVPNTEV